MVKKRPRGTVYVDYLQNILGKTLATAYSARASDYAGVSTPLTWKEVARGVDPRDFTIRTALGALQARSATSGRRSARASPSICERCSRGARLRSCSTNAASRPRRPATCTSATSSTRSTSGASRGPRRPGAAAHRGPRPRAIAARSTKRALLDDLDWLGFVPDVFPTRAFRAGRCESRQSDRSAIYAAAADDARRTRTRVRVPLHPSGPRRAGSDACERGRGCRTPLSGHVPRTSGRAGPRAALAAASRTGRACVRRSPRGPQLQDSGRAVRRRRHSRSTRQLDVSVRRQRGRPSAGHRSRRARPGPARVNRPPDSDRARCSAAPSAATFAHQRLVMKSPTQKLSKSDGDTGVRDLRAAGWSASRVIGLAAYRSGLAATADALGIEAGDHAGKRGRHRLRCGSRRPKTVTRNRRARIPFGRLDKAATGRGGPLAAPAGPSAGTGLAMDFMSRCTDGSS